MNRILIKTEDGGPVDAEHAEAIANIAPGSDPHAQLAEANRRLEACKRPARASLLP